MKRKLAGAAITMLVVAGLVAGCGGDSGGNGATTTAAGGAPLTKAEFIARADAICLATVARIRAGAATLRAEEAKSRRLPPADQIARFLEKTSLPAYDDMLDKLRDLTPPKRDEKAIDAFVGSLAGAIDTAKADPAKYAKTSARDPFDDANARAKRYGMKACGS
jgi:hypothetical protein